MADRLHYGTTAKTLHWLVVALLLIQYPLGWLMPDIHGGMQPGTPMSFHVSFGITILALIVPRLIWRLTHPVAPDASLSHWQRLASEGMHWTLYVLLFATTMTGWLFASFRGWTMSYFSVFPLPMLASESRAGIDAIDGLHQISEWALLIVIGAHVASALAHVFIFRDRILQRMLPG